MTFVELVVMGLALSMDAFAVTVSDMFMYPRMGKGRSILLPVFFGVFQGLMPVLGFFLGSLFGTFISRFAGIISFVVLAFIGGKMLWDVYSEWREKKAALKENPDAPQEPEVKDDGTLGMGALVLQAIATSIDAFIVGISLAAQGANVWVAGSIITITTFLMCVLALLIGRKFGTALGTKAQIVGGVVLILIGLKALIF